ncbi:MAG TPA: hypothetical protein VNV66_07410 [Pilimelia sp.]|nr:hypothetical protein [Pilimelia sp.]
MAYTGTARTYGLPGWRRPAHRPGVLAQHDPRRGADQLGRAVRRGAVGVHLPVWADHHGGLFVGTPGSRPLGRTVRAAVLEPLLRRIAAVGGRVQPDTDAPFELLLELPGDPAEPAAAARAYRLLAAQLQDHAAILTRWTGRELVPGPVTVTLIGALSPRSLLDAAQPRCAFASGTFDDLGAGPAPPHLAPLVGEQWSWRFGWDGREPIPPEERHLLAALVAQAHAEGRRVCFFGVPERPRRVRAAFWSELTAAGVDVVGVRRVPRSARWGSRWFGRAAGRPGRAHRGGMHTRRHHAGVFDEQMVNGV